MSSASATIELIAANDPSITDFKGSGITQEAQHVQLAEAMANNTHVKSINLERCEVSNAAGIVWGATFKTNSALETIDLGYNKLGPSAMIAIGEGLAENKALTLIKLHRQEVEMGVAAEEKIAALWETNTTLQRCYATLHDRSCNQNNTRGETRNKTIAARIKAGKDWMDLDPARRAEWAAQKEAERKEKAAAAAAANAPITAKIESTGGPYTYKQLTCDAKFRPDDVDVKNRPSYLSDEEFQTVFGMDREAFGKLAKWKANGLKKKHNLH